MIISDLSYIEDVEQPNIIGGITVSAEEIDTSFNSTIVRQ